jgi:hypothetical protein
VAGILDIKSRVMDTIITPTGRAQMADGEMQIMYASFTDRQMYYETGSNGELIDPGDRIYFEAYCSDSDLIIPETDAEGALVPFVTDTFNLFGGQVMSGSTLQQDVSLYADELTADSLKSFQRQQILGTRHQMKNEIVDAFTLTPVKTTFYTTTEIMNLGDTIVTASLDDVEALWQDYRVAQTPNYQYLPPRSVVLPGQVTGSTLGNYTKINQDPLPSYDDVLSVLKDQQSIKFSFSNTRTMNDILGQIFEVTDDKLAKLALIDGGTYPVNGSVNPHVYYAGKLYRDTRGALTFANLFTLVFE